MLWRAKFDTWEPDSKPIPPTVAASLSGEVLELHDGDILIGGFDPRAQVELGIWSRLISQADAETHIRTLFLVDAAHIPFVEAVTPKSLWSSTSVGAANQEWESLILPDRPERSFACIVREGLFDPLMIGLPTEEAWDRFLARL